MKKSELAELSTLTDLQDFSNPCWSMREPHLGLGRGRESDAYLRSQFRDLATSIMETLPQVKTVTVGDGMAQDDMDSPITTYLRHRYPTTTWHRHRYWCEPRWHTIAIDGDYPCGCENRGEILHVRSGEFLRWKYST